MEKQRFYRAVSKPIFAGDKKGREVVITFRNDNMQLARDHAEQCFRDTPYGRLDIAEVNFLGTSQPTQMGEFHLI